MPHNPNAFRNDILKNGVNLRRKFTHDGTDYTDLLMEDGIRNIRKSVNLSTGLAQITVNNAGGWWNFLHATNTAMGGDVVIQVYIEGDEANAITLFNGTVDRVEFPDATAVLTVRDKAGYWIDKKMGSNEFPAGTLTANSAEVHAWSILTSDVALIDGANLDSTANPSNPDVDYVAFSAWRDQHIIPNSYNVRWKSTGNTVATMLMKLCMLTHSYIWVNNAGKVDFAPPYKSGYAYNEGNSKNGRKLFENRDKLINDITVRHGYSYSQGTWGGSVSGTNATSIARFRELPFTVEDRIMNHGPLIPATSAESDRDATLARSAFPLKHIMVEAGPPAIMEDIGNAIIISDTLKAISNEQAVVEDIAYNLNPNGFGATMKARWDW